MKIYLVEAPFAHGNVTYGAAVIAENEEQALKLGREVLYTTKEIKVTEIDSTKPQVILTCESCC